MHLTERTDKIEEPRIGPIEQLYALPSPQPSIRYNARRNRTGASGVNRVTGGQITSPHATPNAQDIVERESVEVNGAAAAALTPNGRKRQRNHSSTSRDEEDSSAAPGQGKTAKKNGEKQPQRKRDTGKR